MKTFFEKFDPISGFARLVEQPTKIDTGSVASYGYPPVRRDPEGTPLAPQDLRPSYGPEVPPGWQSWEQPPGSGIWIVVTPWGEQYRVTWVNGRWQARPVGREDPYIPPPITPVPQFIPDLNTPWPINPDTGKPWSPQDLPMYTPDGINPMYNPWHPDWPDIPGWWVT